MNYKVLRRKLRYIGGALLIGLFLMVPGSAQERGKEEKEASRENPFQEKVEIERILTGSELFSPVDIEAAPGDRKELLIVEQDGGIRRYSREKEQLLEQAFLNIRDRIVTGYDMGLLSLVFHPNFGENRKFYLFYNTESEGQLYRRISEFQAAPDRFQGKKGTENILIEEKGHPACRRGGSLAFGPDGYLYIGIGDGLGEGGNPQFQSAMVAQDKTEFRGSILRIDVDQENGGKPYGIPEDNPFRKQGNATPEIWAHGFRNPWRFSFDRKTGDLWVADNGQFHRESLIRVKKGGNYGWPFMEGSILTPELDKKMKQKANPEKFDQPVFEYKHEEENEIYASIGGYVYRGSDIPALQGVYVYSDFGQGKIWGLTQDQENYRIAAGRFGPTTFGEDSEGELYFATRNKGVYKLISASR